MKPQPDSARADAGRPALEPLAARIDNYIWTLAVGDAAIVVDPGEAAPVERWLATTGRRLAGILLTHHHDDHVAAAPALAAAHRAPVHAPADLRIPGPVERVGEGDTVAVAGLRFEVLEVPGHTRSHIAFHGPPWLFCGDTLFSLGCGRLFEGTPEQMLASLDRLAALPDDTQVCCGHEYTLANARFAASVEPGNVALRAREARARSLREAGAPTLPATMAEERACNPFLRVREPAVREAVAAARGVAGDDPVTTFAALRGWKDAWRG